MTTPAATPAQWIEGARPRTLPAAVSPVLAGTGVAAYVDQAVWWKAALALVVALALQVGVNYANDYSDGIRGTDADRVGPLRLVGSGVARPAAVKTAAFAAFGVAMVAGLVLAATTSWWLVLVGAVAIVAAWFYTGGSLAVRLPRARRGDGLRVLRAGRGARHDVRPGPSRCRCPAGTPRSASARWPARSWSPTTCATSRPTGPSASARSRCCSATPAPARSTRCWSGPPWSRSSASRCRPAGGRCSAWCSCCPASPRCGSCSTAPPAATWSRCCSAPAICELLYAAGLFVGLLLATL